MRKNRAGGQLYTREIAVEKFPMPVPETNSKDTIPVSSLYETDFYAWTQEQATLLRKHQWSELDLLNLIEEIESLGKQQRQELRNRLSVLIGH